MSAPRLIGLGIALVAGVVAFVMALGKREEAPVEVIQKIEEKTIRVLVATADLQRGDRLTVDSFRWVDWPEKSISPRYLTEGSITAEDLESAVVRTLIVEGEPVIEEKIVRAGSGSMLAALLEPGKRAVTTRITAESASGGFILPGDHVDVFYTQPEERTGEIVFELLLENVKVLAINSFYNASDETSFIEGSTATLELSLSEAETFSVAQNSRGQLSLALRSIFAPEGGTNLKEQRSLRVVRYGRI
ncbi:MAG: Flp pilus assembly protein CpaB [Pseudomonadota bacterium]